MYKLAKKIRPFIGNFILGKKLEAFYIKKEKIAFAPPIFIIGLPRTGSTLLYQLLCNHFQVSYFSNFASVFFSYPSIMSLITKYVQLNFNIKEFKSYYGITRGMFAPSEGGGIYRYWFNGINSISDETIKDTIFQFTNIYQRPFVWKNLNLSHQIDRLYNIFPNALFIKVDRKLEYVCQSIYLKTRNEGGLNIDGFEKDKFFRGSDPFLEIVKAIKEFEYKLNTQLNNLDIKSVTIKYENLCNNTYNELSRISAAYSKTGCNLVPIRRKFKINFYPSESIKISSQEWNKLLEVIKTF